MGFGSPVLKEPLRFYISKKGFKKLQRPIGGNLSTCTRKGLLGHVKGGLKNFIGALSMNSISGRSMSIGTKIGGTLSKPYKGFPLTTQSQTPPKQILQEPDYSK